MTKDVVDSQDYKGILTGILSQAIDDYVELQHPYTRRKGYLQEFYLESIDFLFDNEYRLENVKNGHGQDMSIQELVSEILDNEKNEVEKLRSHAIQECYKYWDERVINIFDSIPDTVCIAGVTYSVENAYLTGYEIDYENKIIKLDK